MRKIYLSPSDLLCLWYGIGWFGIVLLLYLSLTPRPPDLSIDHGDKIGHALAYALLMYWWAQLFVEKTSRFTLAAALIALGVAIEYMQRWTGWRAFEYHDMLADAVGVLFGWLLASRTCNLLALVQHALDRDRKK